MIRRAFIIFILIGFSNIVKSQPGDPGGDPDNPVPIGGIELLLIAGGALGVKRLMRKK
ncbi:hypothetical protein [Fulvivirga sp.]|uniref:hypothetical protein n=1 Tax=Fulvivirga sp. TaxID=1931237 RepID=UPI0032ED4B80